MSRSLGQSKESITYRNEVFGFEGSPAIDDRGRFTTAKAGRRSASYATGLRDVRNKKSTRTSYGVANLALRSHPDPIHLILRWQYHQTHQLDQHHPLPQIWVRVS